MGIIDDLLANPGTYIGIDREPEREGEAAARIVVTVLPVAVALPSTTRRSTPATPGSDPRSR